MKIEKNYKVLKVNDIAPEFCLRDQYDNLHKLSEYRGKKVLLYFYPKDNTPGCTTQGCNFRDKKEELEKLGLVIFGISKDSLSSHKKFSDKYNFNFPLLSDESLETIKSYNAWAKKKFMGKEFLGILRKSFLINEEGKILKIYESVNTKTHANEIVEDNKLMQMK